MSTTSTKGGALCAALLLSLSAASCGTNAVIDSSGRMHGTVIRVVDGDTAVVKIGSHTEKIRLIGVNTPETHHPTKPVECWGPEAAAHTQSLLPRGTDVVVVRDEVARDKYGRLLAYITRSRDGLFVNHELVSNGWAETLSIPPNTAFVNTLAEAEATAQQLQLGLWGHCRR